MALALLWVAGPALQFAVWLTFVGRSQSSYDFERVLLAHVFKLADVDEDKTSMYVPGRIAAVVEPLTPSTAATAVSTTQSTMMPSGGLHSLEACRSEDTDIL